ncbi:MAG: glycosyltransferase family A protein, partial [Alphaproteobacteria bacterium]|nr:glycosyltransferase family A protein [Alphaproteobacteria bacterium]
MMNGTPALPRCVACVPTWNAEPFIEETLKALAAQTYPNFEVLISDDASTDGTVAICERFAAADSRFRVIQQTRNLGWVGNVNALLRAAKGEYLFFAFHDDLVEPTYAARLIEQLEANPSAVLAFCDLKTVHVDNESEIGAYEELDGIESRMERARRLILRQGDWWIPNRGIFRAEAAKRIGGLKRHLAG